MNSKKTYHMQIFYFFLIFTLFLGIIPASFSQITVEDGGIYIENQYTEKVTEEPEVEDTSDEDRINALTDAVTLESYKSYLAIAAAIIAAIVAGIFNRKLERFKAKLEKENKVYGAKIDYQHDALKKLYTDARPILFQIYQSTDAAKYKIDTLIRLSTKGISAPHLYFENNLDDDFVIDRTVYQLLVPLVYFRLLEKKITLTDLKLDNNIELGYELSKRLFFSFTADFYVSLFSEKVDGNGQTKKIGKLDYEPYTDTGETQIGEMVYQKPEKYIVQGLRVSQIHKAVNSLMKWDANDKTYKVLTLNEFQDKLNPKSKTYDNEFREIFLPVLRLFLEFNPRTKPVLWRILMVQYSIHEALKRHYQASGEEETLENLIKMDPEEKVNGKMKFDWRSELDEKTIDDDAIKERLRLDFAAVEKYLKKRLENLLKETLKDPFQISKS